MFQIGVAGANAIVCPLPSLIGTELGKVTETFAPDCPLIVKKPTFGCVGAME